MAKDQNLVWIDLEMTGLDIETCEIIEIASLVTDPWLNVIAQGPDIVIHQPEDVLARMDSWNVQHHGESGLTSAVRLSTMSVYDAEMKTLGFLDQHCLAGASPLCGNTIGNDRKFLEKYMPKLAAYFHYRSIDVSTVKELVRRWYGDAALPPKRRAHRATEDILESVAELRHYRDTCFRPFPTPPSAGL